MKKGQSGIISIVIIILVVIACVIIVWSIVSVFMNKSSAKISTESFLYSANIKYSLSENNQFALVSVSRKAGGGEITGVIIIFEINDGIALKYENKTFIPRELETKIYNVSSNILGAVNFSNLKKISLYFSYKDSDNKEAMTGELSTASSPDSFSLLNHETGGCVPDITCASYPGQCGIFSDGCTNTLNCNCPSGKTCSAGACLECVPTVPSTEICDNKDNNCNGIIDEGFNLKNDSKNCGSCGNACPDRLFLGPKCTNGSCELLCPSPMANCDFNSSNGCETNLSINPNCGKCNYICPGTCLNIRCYTDLDGDLRYLESETSSPIFYPRVCGPGKNQQCIGHSDCNDNDPSIWQGC